MTTILDKPQHIKALERANEIRLGSVERRQQIKAMTKKEGMLHVARLLENPPEDVARTRLSWLLRAIHAYGPYKIDRLLYPLNLMHVANHRIGPGNKGAGELSERQRVAIAAALRSTI